MLYDHQERIIKDDPKKCGIFLGTGGGKTRTALSLAFGKTLAIMPKTQFLDQNWKREAKWFDKGKFELVTMSKEQFKKVAPALGRFDTVIVDEAHTVCGVTPNVRYRNKQPIPKASQLYESLDKYLRETNPNRVYLCTATPARNPMAVWAAAHLLGRSWDWYKFRDEFYIRLPMPGREVWQPKKDKKTKDHLAALINKLGYVGRLSDWFDVPPQIDKIVHCELSKEQEKEIENLPLDYPDPLVLVGKTHQAEQGKSKIEAIEDLLEEFPKVLVFARYRKQIDEIMAYFSHKMTVYTLTGDTKDRKTMIESAEKDERCLFVAQAQVSTGYELPSFRCAVFASMSYSHVDHMQARGRILRANALNKNLYVYLISGDVDKAVLKCAQEHIDFDERLYAQRSRLPN